MITSCARPRSPHDPFGSSCLNIYAYAAGNALMFSRSQWRESAVLLAIAPGDGRAAGRPSSCGLSRQRRTRRAGCDVCRETSVHRIVAPMNVRTHFACAEADIASAPSRRLRTALALHEDGVAMKRAQLRRQNRTASDEEIARRLAEWLRTRPGATHGDAEGAGKPAADQP
jgi:hypothetical protein